MSELSLYWFSPDFSCNCYIIRFHQLFLYWFSPLGVRGSCFGFPGWHTFWQWMWQRLDKVWYHHGLNKDFMITLIRIEGGSNYDNKRCATSSSTAPSVDRFDCCCDDHWFGIFWEIFGFANFAPSPPHKRTKEKSCTVFYGSSCWLRHHPDTVEAPSTATTTAWAPPWLLRQWFSLFVVL